MPTRRREDPSVSRSRRRWIVGAASAALILSGCTSGPTPQNTATSGTTPPPTPGSPPAPGTPTKAYTDQELMAIINAVAKERNVQGRASDSQSLRIAAKTNPLPKTTIKTSPPECAPFAPKSPDAVWTDANVSFAEGAIPTAAESGPATTILVTVRSAPKDALAAADFNYTDDLLTRCSQFDLTYAQEGSTGAPTYLAQRLKAPAVGDRAHALMLTTKPGGVQGTPGSALRVLAGTMSISMSLGAVSLASPADAQPAIDAMAALARDLASEAVHSPPTVSPPPQNSRTPEQLAQLLQGISGPNGSPATAIHAGMTGASAPPGRAPCTFDDSAYHDALPPSSTAQGMIQGVMGAGKMDAINLSLVSMPPSAAPPYPFDERAETLRDCETIREIINSPGAGTRDWQSIQHLAAGVAGDAGYAISYQLSDGTGERHILLGARRGTLSVEADTIRYSDADVRPAAEALAALISQVFAKAGL